MVHVTLDEIANALPEEERKRIKREKVPCPKCGKKRCECLELAMLDQIREATGATCVRQHRFCPGRFWKFDLALPYAMIAIECEGGTWTNGAHSRGKGYEENCEKYNTATMMGWKVYRFTTGMISDGRARTTIELACAAVGIKRPIETYDLRYPTH